MEAFIVIMFAMCSMITHNLVAQSVPIRGTVLSEDGTPLTGVTVAVTGTNQATVTDNSGKFTLNASSSATLEFTYVGYITQKIKAKAGMEVRLSPGTSGQMDDVVVTAMGIKKERKALGYSVSDLNAAELMKNKNTNLVNSMAGIKCRE